MSGFLVLIQERARALIRREVHLFVRCIVQMIYIKRHY